MCILRKRKNEEYRENREKKVREKCKEKNMIYINI